MRRCGMSEQFQFDYNPGSKHRRLVHADARVSDNQYLVRKVWLINGFTPSQIPAYQKFELTVGDGALEFSGGAEMKELFGQLLTRVR